MLCYLILSYVTLRYVMLWYGMLCMSVKRVNDMYCIKAVRLFNKITETQTQDSQRIKLK